MKHKKENTAITCVLCSWLNPVNCIDVDRKQTVQKHECRGIKLHPAGGGEPDYPFVENINSTPPYFCYLNIKRVLEGFEEFLRQEDDGSVAGHVALSVKEMGSEDPVGELAETLDWYLRNHDAMTVRDVDVPAIHGIVWGLIEKKYDLNAIVEGVKGQAA